MSERALQGVLTSRGNCHERMRFRVTHYMQCRCPNALACSKWNSIVGIEPTRPSRAASYPIRSYGVESGRRGGIRTHDEIDLSGFKDRRQTARLRVNWKMVGRLGIEPKFLHSQRSVLSTRRTTHMKFIYTKTLVRVRRVELLSPIWQTDIIAAIRYAHNLKVVRRVGFEPTRCLLGMQVQ